MSDTAESEQEELVITPPTKKRVQSQENLWPYLPSDRLPLLWGSPPRAIKQRKVKQSQHSSRSRGEVKDKSERSKSKKSRKELCMIKEENEKREEEEEDDDDVEDDDEEDEDKWSSSECWEVKYSPTLTSSPGEPNVLRVHRVRSDIDYVDRELSPCNDILSEKKEHQFNNNNIKSSNNNIYSGADNHQTTAYDLSTHSTTATSNSSSNTPLSRRLSNEDDEEDWNFGTSYQNQVNKERERLEAQILKEDLECQQSEMSQCHPGSSQQSYTNADQYHHKKLHHAKRRNTLDTAQNITITDVNCHQVKVTFVESASGQGFFKEMQTARTGWI